MTESNVDIVEFAESGDLSTALRAWYARVARELPWRSEPTPYRVWVSEIMLQQTQVITVLPYFERWMAALPTVAALAAADLDDVLRLWSGLGYYRRARTLHAAAKLVVAEHGGELPGTVEGLLAIPGIGRYTAGAIASIAFGVRAPLVDGNVIRVYARLFGIEGDPSSSAVQRVVWGWAERLVSAEDPSAHNQALMELGATVCTPRKPLCLLCPLREGCVAHATGRELELPSPKRRTKRRPLHLAAIVAEDAAHGHVLVVQRPEEGLFGGLWELPGVEVAAEDAAQGAEQASRSALEDLAAGWSVGEALGVFEHTLSHIDLTLRVYRASWRGERGAVAQVWGERAAWVRADALDGMALSSLTRRVVEQVMRTPPPAPRG